MSAVTAIAGSVLGGQAQSKAAGAAGSAFQGVSNNIDDQSLVESGIRQLMGSTDANQRYQTLQTNAFNTINSQQQGQLSTTTQQMLGRRAVESGAVGLGGGAVADNYSAYLGISQEQLAQQGVDNYRGYLQQLTQTSLAQQENNYARNFNIAQVNANSALMKGAAQAGMWQGVAAGAGELLGSSSSSGGGGGGSSGGGMDMSSIASIAAMFA